MSGPLRRPRGERPVRLAGPAGPEPPAQGVRGPRFALERFGIVRETTVQGVVADMKYAGLEAGPAASIYVPWRHRPMGLAHLVVRTADDPSGLLPAVRDLTLSLNPGLPVPGVRTLDDHVADSIAGRRLQLRRVLVGVSRPTS